MAISVLVSTYNLLFRRIAKRIAFEPVRSPLFAQFSTDFSQRGGAQTRLFNIHES
jgi:hypothetical protein